MEFGIEKCAILVMEKGKIVKSVGIEDKVECFEGYIRRLRKVLKSKLNGGNLVRGVNTWAVSLLRYSAGYR